MTADLFIFHKEILNSKLLFFAQCQVLNPRIYRIYTLVFLFDNGKCISVNLCFRAFTVTQFHETFFDTQEILCNSSLVHSYISLLNASVSLIQKLVKSIDWLLYEGNTGIYGLIKLQAGLQLYQPLLQQTLLLEFFQFH